VIATAPDGTRLHYVVQGTGPPLVLVGGKTSTIEGAWWRYLPVLARELRVIAFDNRGAGASDKPDVPYTTELLAEDAIAVLLAAGETSAHWFGLSLGGMVLQSLALARSAAVRSLILGATHCGGETPLVPLSAADQAALAENPHRRLANLYSTRFLLEYPAWVAEDATHFGKMPLHAIQRQDQAVRHHRACDGLSEIECPVLILQGRQDRMVPVERARELARLLPNAELRIVEGGHQFHSESFSEVVAAILDFVHRVERARASG
jgi:3-oxoadipate enol-lactonase